MSSGISVSSSTHRSRSNGEPTYTTTARAITTLTRVSRAAIRLLQSLWLDELSQTLPVPHLVSPPNPRLPPPEMPPLLLLHRDPGVLPNSSPDNRDPLLLRPKQQRGYPGCQIEFLTWRRGKNLLAILGHIVLDYLIT